MARLEIKNLKYRYPYTDRLALDGITCTIEPGEFISVIGKNGSGKSTFTQALIGLVPNFYRGAYGGSAVVLAKGNVLLEGTPEVVFAEAEVLEKAYLEQPNVTQLCCALGQDKVFLTTDAYVEYMRK